MKKHYFFKFVLLLIPVSAFLLMSSSGGRTDGRSGSPGDSSVSCATCHSGGNFSSSLNITTDIPASGYNTNTAYNVTVTNNSTGASGHGFQLVAEKTANNSKTGTFAAGSGSRINGTADRITHTGDGQNSWSFTWTSPATDEGEVKFYAASVATNGNGGTSGDEVVTTSTSGNTALGISEAKRLRFDMYPNPSTDNLTIQLPSGSEKATVKFYDYIGKLALTKTVFSANDKINVESLKSGVYILKVISEDKIGSQKFIKN
ncbi:T9SS type A sorting domain-containing protein [Polaribacter sp.]|nr:T9SS type A sorting domain-containing protein [Polaribacter sp.]